MDAESTGTPQPRQQGSRRLPWTAVAGLIALVASALAPLPLQAADVFAGKTIKLVVGMPPGGGADTYARLLQRHIVDHIPGRPAMVVQNMPGAGSLRSVQSLAGQADDATTIVTFTSTLLTDSVLHGDQIKVDFRDFRFIGNIAEDARVCYFRNAAGVRTYDDLTHTPIVFAATAASQPEASMIEKVLGLKMRIVLGYSGSADKRLALERGEADGDCGGWTSIPAEWRAGNTVKVLFRISPTALPGMGDSMPWAGDLVKDARLRRIFEFLTAPTRLGRPFLVKGKAPAEQLEILRSAFDSTVNDPRFVAEAEKMELTVTPTRGVDVDREVGGLYATPRDLVEQARAVTTP